MSEKAPPLDLKRIDSLLGSGSKFNVARSGKRPVDADEKFRAAARRRRFSKTRTPK